MFEVAQQSITAKIQSYCSENDIPQLEAITWQPIPFSGEWGISTSFFQVAALEARSGKKVLVPQRAQEIAESIAVFLGMPEGFSRVEAVRGYLNLYFVSEEFSRIVVDTVLDQGANFGRGAPKGERVMVEYAQPNTHHSFHIGHYRNAILGEVLSRIVEFAGFDTHSSRAGDLKSG